MKARTGCALGLLAGGCLIGSAQAQSVVVGPQASSMAVVPGAMVTVPIVADMTGSGGRSLGSVVAGLAWRPGVLAFRGVGTGALGAPTINADSAAGTLRFALANPTGVTGQSVLLNAVFAVVGSPGATDTLRLTLSELTNAGTFADLLPIGQAMNAPVCVSTGLFGDLTTDGAINSADALVILTNAVGLPIAPRTTVNGDVDGDGAVSTRDALVVLSYAVGLPVGGFRVSRLNPGLCTMRTAASVQLSPRSVSVTSGDRLPLTAVVRDSAGAAIQGNNLLWTSNDTTIVKADAAGNVVAVGPGSVLVFARAAPGLKDSVVVTVSPTRHVWYVDQALAARNGGVELGSAPYPFSGIRQALSRAAANDSVMIAPATYGEGVRLTVPLTLVGDSTTAGVTTIRNPTGPGIVADSLGSGLVRLDRLHIDDAQGGIIVRGAGTGVVDLKGVTVERSRGVGISVRRVERLLLDGVAVRGAVHQGIEVDSVPKVRSYAALVDVIAEQTDVPRAVHVSWADSAAFDSLVVITAGVLLDSVVAANLDRFTSRDTRGPGIEAYVRSTFTLDRGDVSGAVEVDTTRGESPYGSALMIGLSDAAATARVANTRIHDNGRPALGSSGGDSVLVSRLSVSNSPWRQDTTIPWTVAFGGWRRVAVEYSHFTDNHGAHVGFEHYDGLMTASVDSSTFQGTALRGQHLVAMDVRRSRFRNTTESAVEADNVGNVSLVRLDIANLAVEPDYDAEYGGAFAVDVSEATALSFDSLWVHDNPFGAVICRYCGDIQGVRSVFTNNGLYTWAGYKGSAQVTTLAFDHPQRVLLYRDSVEGKGDIGAWFRVQDGTGGRQLVIDSSAFGGQTVLVRADGSNLPSSGDSLVVKRSALRGHDLGRYAVGAYGLGGVTVSRSLVDSVYQGVYVGGWGTAAVYGNTVRAADSSAFEAQGSTFTVDSNTITGCGTSGVGVRLDSASGTVSRNNISGCHMAVQAFSAYASGLRVDVVGNTIVRDTLGSGSAAAISINGSYDSVIVAGNQILGGRGRGVELMASYYGISGARVDSNFVQGVLTEGVGLGGVPFTGPVAMRYNTLADNRLGLYSQVSVLGELNTVVRNMLYGVLLDAPSGASTFRRANFVGNGHWALFNNYVPYVLADNSYWGDPLGPRCGPPLPCPGSTGDSINVAVNYAPVAAAPVADAPPIPLAPLPAAVFRSARPATVARPREVIDRPRPPTTLQSGRVRP